MKLKIITMFATALLLFMSCSGGDSNQIIFETTEVDKTVKLSNEEMAPSCQVSLKVAFAKETEGNEAAKQINAYLIDRLFNMKDMSMEGAAQHFADEYTKAYQANLLPLYNQDRADTTKRAWYEYHYVITSETHPGNEGTVVYLATLDYFEGGAHGNNLLITMNFDTKTGKILTLSDIFAGGYEQQLTAILLKALKEKVGVSSLGELKEKGYLTAVDMFPSENFILDEGTITFVYNTYEIAPFNLGMTELIIPYDDVKDLLKTTFNY